jgi:hypothetical protein
MEIGYSKELRCLSLIRMQSLSNKLIEVAVIAGVLVLFLVAMKLVIH